MLMIPFAILDKFRIFKGDRPSVLFKSLNNFTSASRNRYPSLPTKAGESCLAQAQDETILLDINKCRV